MNSIESKTKNLHVESEREICIWIRRRQMCRPLNENPQLAFETCLLWIIWITNQLTGANKKVAWIENGVKVIVENSRHSCIHFIHFQFIFPVRVRIAFSQPQYIPSAAHVHIHVIADTRLSPLNFVLTLAYIRTCPSYRVPFTHDHWALQITNKKMPSVNWTAIYRAIYRLSLNNKLFEKRKRT